MKEQQKPKQETAFHDTDRILDDPFRLQYYLIGVRHVMSACEMYLTGLLPEQANAYRILEYWGLDPFTDEIHASKIMGAAREILETYQAI